jgi:hypothetical protein
MARNDPAAFASSDARLLIVDEIQRAPELLLEIKASVDRDRRPGRFVLTGSADVLTLPRVSETLAGRMEVLRLWPLSQAEVEGHRGGSRRRCSPATWSASRPRAHPATAPT